MNNRTLAAMGAALTLTSASFASVYNLVSTINGSTPTGSAPFLSATFTNAGANNVTLTMVNHMPTSNFVDNWVFNVSTASALTFTFISGNVATTSSGANFTNGGNNMKAGLFDIEFEWPTANSNANRFSGGETTVYKLSGAGLTENSFAVASAQDSHGYGGYATAAHVQGFGSSGSIGAAVPEPASLAVMALGLVAALRLKRKS